MTLALRGGFTLESRARQVSAGAAAVAPDVEHSFDAEGLVAHLFVDPEGRPGRALLRALFSGEPPLDWVLQTHAAFSVDDACRAFDDCARGDLETLFAWLSDAALIRPLPAPEWDRR